MRIHAISERATREESAFQLDPTVELEDVELDPVWLNKKIKLGTELLGEIKTTVIRVLIKYHVMFAWGPEDMLGSTCQSLLTNWQWTP